MKKIILKVTLILIAFLTILLLLFWGYLRRNKAQSIVKEYLEDQYSIAFTIEYMSASISDNTRLFRIAQENEDQRSFYITLKGDAVIQDTYLLSQLSNELISYLSQDLSSIWGDCKIYVSLKSAMLSNVPLVDIDNWTMLDKLECTGNLHQTIYIQPEEKLDYNSVKEKYDSTVELLVDLNQKIGLLTSEWIRPVICLMNEDEKTIIRKDTLDNFQRLPMPQWLEENMQNEGIRIGGHGDGDT